MIEKFILENIGAVSQGGSVSAIIILFILGYMKIKQQCLSIQDIRQSLKVLVRKDACDATTGEIKERISETKSENKEAHKLLFSKADTLQKEVGDIKVGVASIKAILEERTK